MGEAPPDYELSTFSYQHTILAVAAVVEADQDAVPVTLYRWYPPAISASTSVVLPLAMLLTISGFAPLGTFFVPDNLDISSALSQLLTAAPPPTQHLDGQLLASLMAQLCIVPGRGGGTFRQFFSFPVFSNRPDLYFSDDGLLPAWKWVKPDGEYRKKGFWEAELREALQDGERTGGRGLMVLMGGVSEQTLQIIASPELGWKFSSLDRAERISGRGG